MTEVAASNEPGQEISTALLGADNMTALAPQLVRWVQRELGCAEVTLIWSPDWPANLGHYPRPPSAEQLAQAHRLVAAGEVPNDGFEEGSSTLAMSAASGGACAVLLCSTGPEPDLAQRQPSGYRPFLLRVRAYLINALEKKRLRESVERLGRSEQLQRALFAIADMASSELDMPEMLRGLHALIGSLMYAENLYIALYEPTNDTIRFIYFADVQDDQKPNLEESYPMARFERGLTWYLIRDRKPLMGSLDELKQQVSGPLHLRGSNSVDWLGVPMIRGQTAYGALVVQCYVERPKYTTHDQALLAFVASHVLTALERKQAYEGLERRVQQRTSELASANAVLTAEVQERQRGERLQRALYRIAELTSTISGMEQFYPAVHGIVGELIVSRNF